MSLLSVFLPITAQVYVELFSAIFGDGKRSVNFKTIASKALAHCSTQDDFQAAYLDLRRNPIVLYLTGFKPDSWKFDLGGIKAHGLSCMLHDEATTYVRYFVV